MHRQSSVEGSARNRLAWRALRSAVLSAATTLIVPGLLPLVAPPFTFAADPIPTDEQAASQLNAARRAYNDRNYPQAVNLFREYTQKFTGNKDLPSAWYGLGIALLDGPRDDQAAADAFKLSIQSPDSPDKPFAHYFFGIALKNLGAKELKVAAEKPAEADAHTAAAKAKFLEAEQQFGAAANAWAAAKQADDPAKLEWTFQAILDTADAAIRGGRFKEAANAAKTFLDDAKSPSSKLRPLGLYHLGHALFSLKDWQGAGRALSQLAPFNQPFGPHARYLLARVHQQQGDRPEAGTQYQALLAGYEQFRKDAQQQLQQGGNTLVADRKAYLEAIATGPVPDYVRRAAFYQAVLLSDDGKFAEARELFVKFYMELKDHPLASEARLRAGFCQLQSKQYADAQTTLKPLADDANVGDQATWYAGRAQLLSADLSKPESVEQSAKIAIDLLKLAATKAQTLAAKDPAAKNRRAEILLDLGDAQVQAKQFKEAAGTYQAIVAENAFPERVEEAAQRQVTALHYAGDYATSDVTAAQFEQRFPKSTLLPAVWFRAGENAYLAAVAADKPGLAGAEKERLYNNAIVRYQKLVDKYPEFVHINLARLGMGQSYYKLGKFEQAITPLKLIPDADRSGDLATVPYLQADAMLRTFPAETEDALSAAGLIQTAEQAAKFFESFAGSNKDSPLTADAMLKQGYCYQRMAGLLAEKQEREKSLQTAREIYEKHLQRFRGHATEPAVVLERAKVLAMQGDVGGAINELRRFQTEDRFRSAPNAPLAAARLASLYRSQNQPKEAADLLTRIRAEQEATLAKDPARADWVTLLAYEHALSVKEAGKPADARKLFEDIATKNAGKPEAANSAWRAVQCRREELAAQLADARLKLNQPGANKAEREAAAKVVGETGKLLAEAANPLDALTGQLQQQKASADSTQAVLYELCWCDRLAGEAETEVARQKLRQEALEKVLAKLPKRDGQTPPTLIAPDVPTTSIPLQPGELRAKDRYQKLIAVGPDSPLAARARFELAELLGDRGDFDGALDLLNGALLTTPTEDLVRRIKLRMAVCFIGKGDGKTAMQAVQPIVDAAIKPNQPTQWNQAVGEARFLQAESMIRQENWDQAIKLLTPFRDQEPLRSQSGLADRALFRLGQAYARANQWIPSLQAFEQVVNRFPQSPWAEEARFGMGFAYQNQNRFDEAANTYAEVTKRTAAEVAARAQVHIGLSRISQKRYADAATALLVVPYTYDYPEWSAAACLEAAKAYKELQKPKEAASMLNKVVAEYPDTKAAVLAKAKLNEK